MHNNRNVRWIWRGLLLPASLLTLISPANAQHYTQANLNSNFDAAAKTDPNLVNAWGMSRSSTSPWWISDNGTGLSTLYDGTGAAAALVVTVPGSPTGTIYNGSTDFELTPTHPARFLFAAEDGSISGWSPAVSQTAAVVMVSTPGAIYKGLAMATLGGKRYLYAADFHNGRIDVFDSTFQKVSHAPGEGSDDDIIRFPGTLRGYAPFNIQNLGGTLFVAYAKQDDEQKDEVAGPGLGLVAAFTPAGRLIRVFEHVPGLNAPWGLALAPGDFGTLSHHLLVGQFGSGEILAFNIMTGKYAGKLLNADNNPIVIEGLWGISFGSGGNSGAFNALYYAAGPSNETYGLFGMLTPVTTDLIQGNGN